MSILTINLKHLYQRRGLWLVYAFLGLFVFSSILVPFKRPVAGQGHFIGLVVLAFLIGLIAAALPIEVLSKPFSYCLPGHRKVARRFVFCVGIVFNLCGALLFFVYPYLNAGQLVLVVCSAFSAGLISYLLGVWLAFGVMSSAAFIGFLPLVIVGGGFFGLHRVLERAIVGIPFGVILVGILSSVVAWIWLGDEGRARRYCAVPWVGFFDAWNRDKLQRYRRVRAAIKWDKLKQHPSPWVETFFLGRMNRHDYVSTGRYIWGGLYTTFGMLVLSWKEVLSVLLLALLIVCFLGYMGPWTINILFIMPGLMIAQMRLPVYSSMLISGGRNERYRGAVILVVAAALLITVLLNIIAVLSVLLATIMPDFTLRGRTFIFQAMDIRLFFVPLLMIPIVFTVQLIFYRKPILMALLIMLVFAMLFITSMFLHEHLNSDINPMFIIGIGGLVLSWGTFLLVSHYICKRRCLAG